MRIIHTTTEYPPATTGGLGTYIEGLVRFQERRGDRVELVFQGEGHIDRRHHPRPLLDDHGRPIAYSATELPDGDILVCHDWHGVVATSPLWRRGMPMVWMCHLPISWDIGDFHDVACERSNEMEFTAALRADTVACVSEAVKRQINETYPFTIGKTTVVPNGTDTEFFTPVGTPSRNGKHLLYVGRYQAQKGFDLIPDIMAQAWARDPDITLELMGIGPMDELVAARLAPPRPDAVRWTAFGPLEAVRQAYRRATAVIMPSRFEPFGLVAVEAMACGRPVIAARTGGLVDTVVPGQTGDLVDADSPEQYAASILTLLSQPDLADRMGAAARQQVTANYSLEDRMGAVCDMYEQTITARQNGDPARRLT